MAFTLTFLVGSFFLSLLLVFIIIQNFSKQLLDIPNERSSHVRPTPRGGGLGFIISFIVAILCLQFVSTPYFTVDPFLLVIILPLAIVGFLDDRLNLPSLVRYGVQLVTAILGVIHYGIFPQPWLTNIGLVGVIIAGILTVIGFTALINFYNFMDGLDGFVVSITIIQLSFIAFYLNQPIWWLLIGALFGFLWWNWSPAKIFMGDVGSTVLGAMIAIALIQVQDTTIAWSSLAITLPITADTIYTLIVRLRHKENIFQAHRTHIYQRLQQSGWSHRQVALTYSILTGAIALLIINLQVIGSWLSLMLVIGLIFFAQSYISKKTTKLN
ncbi:glycosyltransferase family 4 protein [Cyanobacterium aponinum UTEX 3222]|uniref:MraY family glycosyltransferase n=1 Tax=Cyanobacterium aponinum TaxID=379064 RepID=UPI002B4BAE4F|nr:glycosyltransferase family 4 protein [Cyanobacterium aponinum]WRL36893.1 glycosyltransferase family 4 protein [Cyanobacterium aponinum UTEX 3221]WRL43226.1 glycosyltransferase family 4 protein [Cyanobacterium aponinum UTEX 3222]